MDTLPVAWLTAQCLQEGAAAILLTVCGTLLMGQRDPLQGPPIGNGCFYSAHKRVHAMKYQKVMTPFGIIGQLLGPV